MLQWIGDCYDGVLAQPMSIVYWNSDAKRFRMCCSERFRRPRSYHARHALPHWTFQYLRRFECGTCRASSQFVLWWWWLSHCKDVVLCDCCLCFCAGRCDGNCWNVQWKVLLLWPSSFTVRVDCLEGPLPSDVFLNGSCEEWDWVVHGRTLNCTGRKFAFIRPNRAWILVLSQPHRFSLP